MCGIIGYAGPRNAQEVLLDGLRRLEYRGYDSAGVAIVGSGLQVFKDKGEISKLYTSMPEIRGNLGVGHTRWATCGKPSKQNAHPFVDCTNQTAVVHNGIIENYQALRKQLTDEGHKFTSETDTEVLVHLLEKHYRGNLRAALISALKEVKGTYAVVALRTDSNEIVAARKENPLVVGLGVGENILASDVTAMLNYTQKALYVMDGETVSLTADKVTIYDRNNDVVVREPSTISWTIEDAQKGGFEHYMLKEIYEQPTAIHNSLLGSLDEIMSEGSLVDQDFGAVKLVACGTSYHASMVGKYIIEALAKIPVTVELASEYRYSPGTGENPLTVMVTQSGETADTLAAAREAKRRGCHTLAVTNVVGSTIAREVDSVFYTKAGPEIGVAATKTYSTQLMAMYLLGLRLGYLRKAMGRDEIRSLSSELRSMPQYVRGVLDRASEVDDSTDMLVEARDVFFLGRNINYPTMLEGALKLKEISYIHAEGYAAGELKHGPLALLDASTPVVAACIKDHTYEKMLSNISETAARDSPILAIGEEGDEELLAVADKLVTIPHVAPILSPVPLTVVVQLIAYYAAKKRGCPIDKPRNLAKSVTVD
ncbi:glutamine--fructose-6-phosphate transaminase (isomerizing) [Methanomassiliicoccus luminyensis]|uniref:glutamine--fructose-6-phosphate transaminase (isomerizing) n=1 Tax=Methanomassiliicoccus luminyensis TaxID=1080712 RepID=UPI0003775F41|nr:glutamine--fructose-6-phosphate transaminase (isomerizing) [Methanomassiliicoccus luminyensis]